MRGILGVCLVIGIFLFVNIAVAYEAGSLPDQGLDNSIETVDDDLSVSWYEKVFRFFTGNIIRGPRDKVSVDSEANETGDLEVVESDLPKTQAIEACVPKTCIELEKECGIHSNGCSRGTIDCGSCGFGDCVSGSCVVTEAVELDPSLVAHYNFEDGFKDSVSNGTAIEKGSPEVVSSERGNVLSLDGSSYLDISEDFRLGKLTISAWINLDEHDGQYAVLGHSNSRWITPFYLYLRTQKNNEIAFGSNSFLRAGNIEAQKWIHVVGTYDGSKVVIYQDGVKVGSKNTSISLSPINDLFVGYMPTLSNPKYFKGKMDDVRIYNKALSSGDVSSLYNASKDGSIEVVGVVAGAENVEAVAGNEGNESGVVVDGNDGGVVEGGNEKTGGSQVSEVDPNCVPKTCSGLNRECGQISDGCGGFLECGGCDSLDLCKAGTCNMDCGNYLNELLYKELKLSEGSRIQQKIYTFCSYDYNKIPRLQREKNFYVRRLDSDGKVLWEVPFNTGGTIETSSEQVFVSYTNKKIKNYVGSNKYWSSYNCNITIHHLNGEFLDSHIESGIRCESVEIDGININIQGRTYYQSGSSPSSRAFSYCPTGCGITIGGLCNGEKNTCKRGKSKAFSEDDNFNYWICEGLLGGEDIDCRLHKPVDGVCGSGKDSCLFGSVKTKNEESFCMGAYGGKDARCSASIKKKLVCEHTNTLSYELYPYHKKKTCLSEYGGGYEELKNECVDVGTNPHCSLTCRNNYTVGCLKEPTCNSEIDKILSEKICDYDFCGDGVVREDLGEQCDDGNGIDGDGCNTLTNNCQYTCGDGSIQESLGEQCDDGLENGVECVPGMGEDCNYCNNDCQKVNIEGLQGKTGEGFFDWFTSIFFGEENPDLNKYSSPFLDGYENVDAFDIYEDKSTHNFKLHTCKSVQNVEINYTDCLLKNEKILEKKNELDVPYLISDQYWKEKEDKSYGLNKKDVGFSAATGSYVDPTWYIGLIEFELEVPKDIDSLKILTYHNSHSALLVADGREFEINNKDSGRPGVFVTSLYGVSDLTSDGKLKIYLVPHRGYAKDFEYVNVAWIGAFVGEEAGVVETKSRFDSSNWNCEGEVRGLGSCSLPTQIVYVGSDPRVSDFPIYSGGSAMSGSKTVNYLQGINCIDSFLVGSRAECTSNQENIPQDKLAIGINKGFISKRVYVPKNLDSLSLDIYTKRKDYFSQNIGLEVYIDGEKYSVQTSSDTFVHNHFSGLRDKTADGILEFDFVPKGDCRYFDSANSKNVAFYFSVDKGTCGNGVIEGLEECDNGNLFDGDGCNSLCKLEKDYCCELSKPENCMVDNTPSERVSVDSSSVENIVIGEGCANSEGCYDLVSFPVKSSLSVGDLRSSCPQVKYVVEHNLKTDEYSDVNMIEPGKPYFVFAESPCVYNLVDPKDSFVYELNEGSNYVGVYGNSELIESLGGNSFVFSPNENEFTEASEMSRSEVNSVKINWEKGELSLGDAPEFVEPNWIVNEGETAEYGYANSTECSSLYLNDIEQDGLYKWCRPHKEYGFWRSANKVGWVQFDLGERKAVSSLEINFPEHISEKFHISVSEDGFGWVKVTDTVELKDDLCTYCDKMKEFNFEEVIARYVKIDFDYCSGYCQTELIKFKTRGVKLE